ncbi:hypothetical protein STEG23_016533 [Scotinomys teguina]
MALQESSCLQCYSMTGRDTSYRFSGSPVCRQQPLLTYPDPLGLVIWTGLDWNGQEVGPTGTKREKRDGHSLVKTFLEEKELHVIQVIGLQTCNIYSPQSQKELHVIQIIGLQTCNIYSPQSQKELHVIQVIGFQTCNIYSPQSQKELHVIQKELHVIQVIGLQTCNIYSPQSQKELHVIQVSLRQGKEMQDTACSEMTGVDSMGILLLLSDYLRSSSFKSSVRKPLQPDIIAWNVLSNNVTIITVPVPPSKGPEATRAELGDEPSNAQVDKRATWSKSLDLDYFYRNPQSRYCLLFHGSPLTPEWPLSFLQNNENLWIASRLVWFDQPRPPDSSQTAPVRIGS